MLAHQIALQSPSVVLTDEQKRLLQARGVISVAERQAYMGRVRDLAKGACAAWIDKNSARWAEKYEGWSA